MSLRSSLVATSLCLGCLLSGCAGGQDKKEKPKLPREKILPPEKRPVTDKKPDPKQVKETPPKAEDKNPEPKLPKEFAKATIEAWEKRGFIAGWRGTNSAGEVAFAEQAKALRNAMPAFRAAKATDDAGLKSLPPAEIPFALMLNNTKVTDAGLKELAGLPNLVSLDLTSTKVKGTGLSALAGLNLTSLEIRSNDLPDAALSGIAGLTKLSYLGLGNNEVTDAGLKHLAGLQNLTSLDLDLNKVTDAGLKHLVGLKNLTSLNLSLTKVTDAGRKELQAALPRCGIIK
jgi:internalin A